FAVARILGFVLYAALSPDPDSDPFSAPPLAFVLVTVTMILGLGGVLWLGLLRWKKLSLSELGWRTKEPGRELIFGFLGLLASLLSTALLLLAFGIDLKEVLQEISSFTLSQRVLFALIGFQAAVGEESIFRGYLQPALVTRVGRPAALVLMALI